MTREKCVAIFTPKLKAAVPLSLISLTNGVWWQLSNSGWKRDLLKHGNTENKEGTRGSQKYIYSKFTQLKEEVLGAVSIVNYFRPPGVRNKSKKVNRRKVVFINQPLGIHYATLDIFHIDNQVQNDNNTGLDKRFRNFIQEEALNI